MKKMISTFLVILMTGSFLFANGEQETESSADGTVWIENWTSSNRFGSWEKSHPINDITTKEIGVGIQAPLVSWNGGADYLQRLNLAIASDEMPDMFTPWLGNEYELAKQGALMPLDDLLPKYAPILWNSIPENIWNIVRANSPDGKIYYVPQIWKDFTLSSFIRIDWLDRLGLEMPTTIEEYENVLRAFKEQDANGNGDPSDEIPTSGRENIRWIDHLFAPFGVAIYEGNPQWDIYDGEVTFSAVTPNMKAALQWVTKLYAEGLLDIETLINTNKMWDGKIRDNRVGSWYHGAQWAASRLQSIKALAPDVKVEALPVLKAEGYEGFYSAKSYNNAMYVFSSRDEEKVIGGLRWLEFFADPESKNKYPGGWPGFSVTEKNGELVSMSRPENIAELTSEAVQSPDTYKDKWYFQLKDPELGPLAQMSLEIMRGTSSNLKQIAGQAIPTSIYQGFQDYQTYKLFREYAGLIILGEYDIDKFDEFVEKWYAQGGTEITARARAAYAKIK